MQNSNKEEPNSMEYKTDVEQIFDNWFNQCMHTVSARLKSICKYLIWTAY